MDENFGQLLHVMRRRAGLSQEDLAATSGSSVRTIRELERGRVKAPQRRTVQLMADALNLSDDERDHFYLLSQVNRFTGIDIRAGRAPRGAKAALPAAQFSVIPRQLPAVIPGLFGRETQLSAIRRLTSGANHRTGLMVIHGPPGIGKTSLAVAGGHLVSASFADGQLFADLRGTSPDGPTPTAEVLAQLLHSLGVPDGAIPPPGAAREGLLRTLLWDRRTLIVLDDAFDESQVRPLLPPNSNSQVLITSQRPLRGLDGAARIRLDVLPTADARRMLTMLIGPRRATADPGALDSLIRLCGSWPLALRITGNRLAGSPTCETQHMVDHLQDPRLRLSAFAAGDLDVRTTLAAAYRQMKPSTARVFASAATLSDAGFTTSRVAAAAGIDTAAAAVACDELVDAGLLHCHGVHYQFNELVRLFAAECVANHSGPRAHSPQPQMGLRPTPDPGATGATRAGVPRRLSETGSTGRRGSRMPRHHGSDIVAALLAGDAPHQWSAKHASLVRRVGA